MPRTPLTKEQKMKYKLLDFKAWVHGQMKLNHLTQREVAKALGISQTKLNGMLKTPDKKRKDEKIKPDPFTLGQIIILFELFETEPEERDRLLTL